VFDVSESSIWARTFVDPAWVVFLRDTPSNRALLDAHGAVR